jgi:hypothetical protein
MSNSPRRSTLGERGIVGFGRLQLVFKRRQWRGNAPSHSHTPISESVSPMQAERKMKYSVRLTHARLAQQFF